MSELTLDNLIGEIVVRGLNGRELRGVAPPVTINVPNDPIVQVTVRVPEQVVEMKTRGGEQITVEQYAFDNQLDRRRGRPTIYLDQNKWIQIAQAIHMPGRLNAAELTAAQALIERAKEQEVILLLSGGHWLETGPTFGARRERLATTMVGLSRGWLLRDPLQVRAAELANTLRGPGAAATELVDPEAITLDYRALFTGVEDESFLDDDLPMTAIQNVFSGGSAILSVLIHDERVVADDNRSDRWAQAQEHFAQHLARQETRIHARDLTREWFLRDLGQHLSAIAFLTGHNERSLERWWANSEQALSSAPYLSRSREILHRRLMNTSNRWEVNDLVDLMFLPLAAAYADHVVCERKTALDLTAVATAVPPGATVHRDLGSLLRTLG